MNTLSQLPWYRQFWPWFILGLLGTAVSASLVTVWIAFDAAPVRVDGAGLLEVPVVLATDKSTLEFDMGLSPPGTDWPEEFQLTLVYRPDATVHTARANQISPHRFSVVVPEFRPGTYQVMLQAVGRDLALSGLWPYPASAWRLNENQ